MKVVNIADLKNRLSAYLQEVRAGEEIVVRDRNLPIAKLVPLTPAETSAEELALAAEGKLLLPSAVLDEGRFWGMDGAETVNPELQDAVRRAVSRDREEPDGRVLGR